MARNISLKLLVFVLFSLTIACSAEWRSYNGYGNNLKDPTLGMANTTFLRSVKPSRYNAFGYLNLSIPSARYVSNNVMDQPFEIASHEGLTDLFNMFGQFLIHNMAFAQPDTNTPWPITVPECDEYFDPWCSGNQTMSYFRTRVALVDCAKGNTNPQEDGRCYEQINALSSFIDANPVYGSTKETADLLRSFSGGQLRVSKDPHGDMPPRGIKGVTIDNDARRVPIDQLFTVGEKRGNENPGLMSIHTIFLREHNRLAKKFSGLNSSMTDEEIYQKTRSCIIEQVQALTYNEYLPMILGHKMPDYKGYDENADPRISNEFTTVAFRFGHSEVGPVIEMGNRDGSFGTPLPIRDSYFNPNALSDGIEPIIRGLAFKVEQNVDPYMISDLRNFLFGKPGQGGFDLACRNIQRERDHAIPSYNKYRSLLGLPSVKRWSDISREPIIQSNLRYTYDNKLDNVDLFVGGLAENHVPGGCVGQTFYTMILEQFTRSRSADRFWYERENMKEINQQCERTTFRELIRRNTNDIGPIQNNVFKVPTDL
ncbi:peroxinectin [Heterostelium album PN500]|uniref:Peroxinectin n=1 Tax=Heterostelium pallidum (strain ATCC 26659 / Pp 5 / PN500) TaxID=670386 RepID=D3B167_HETP5|nr:peroxinectin [Heterostelium album PN500]EFA85041.1 peroxinectin [Heterostelium album PN500]|eukprot:XP_020437151.1 peroxinectin [Heterostelium album PN500]